MKAFEKFKKELPPYFTWDDAVETTWRDALEWVLKYDELCCERLKEIIEQELEEN